MNWGGYYCQLFAHRKNKQVLQYLCRVTENVFALFFHLLLCKYAVNTNFRAHKESRNFFGSIILSAFIKSVDFLAE